MEHDVCTLADGPADRFRIAPPLMTDDNAKPQWPGLKDVSSQTRGIRAFFGRIDLDFILKASYGAVLLDDERGSQEMPIDNPLGAKNHRDFISASRRRNG